jgi:hypothetical protein
MHGIRCLAETTQEIALFQRIFWVVYSIEKPLAMRLGRSSVSFHIYGVGFLLQP